MVPAATLPEQTVLYDGAIATTRATLPYEEDLWLTPDELRRVSGFILKPEGACLEALCVPIPDARHEAFTRHEGGVRYFNLSELARELHQPTIRDATHSIWVFGTRPATRMKLHDTLEAPDFTLPDWKGNTRSLAEFRGRKVLLLTWASW